MYSLKSYDELENISDKNNALVIAGLTLANKLLVSGNKKDKKVDIDYTKLIKKIEKALEK